MLVAYWWPSTAPTVYRSTFALIIALAHTVVRSQPSMVLLDVQQAVPGIFSDAKYEECYRKGFNSFARFSLLSRNNARTCFCVSATA